MQSTQKPIAVLGAGSWGSALALYLSRRGQTIRIWSIETSEINEMIKERANNRYLPGFPLPESMHPMTDLAATVKDMEYILMAVPSIGYRDTLKKIKPLILPNTKIISATKGIDGETGELLNEVVEEVLGKSHQFAVLSGPSFAKEVAAGLPCAVAIASDHQAYLDELTERFDSPIFRIAPTKDVIGVEIGGIVKNVIAIACGISDGMELGTGARSALITYGLAEITRLGVALGGKAETFVGLSGLGDLMLTCSDNLSRNRRLGLAIGKGKNITEAEREIGQAVEGKRNAELVVKLAAKHHIKMPITENIWKLLQGKINSKETIEQIFQTI